MARCGCGIPRKADFHVGVIVYRDLTDENDIYGTETGDVDIYVCADHLTTDIQDLLRIGDDWGVIESVVTELR